MARVCRPFPFCLTNKYFDMEIIFHFLDCNLKEISVHRLELQQHSYFETVTECYPLDFESAAESYPLEILRQFDNCVAWRSEIAAIRK